MDATAVPISPLSMPLSAKPCAARDELLGVFERRELTVDDEGPCPGCALREHCARGYACDAFAGFAEGLRSEEWRAAPREPSVTIFRRIFGRLQPPVALPANSAVGQPLAGCVNCWRAWAARRPRSELGYCHHIRVAWRAPTAGELMVDTDVGFVEYRQMRRRQEDAAASTRASS